MHYEIELAGLNDEIEQARKDMRTMIADLAFIQRGIDLAESRIEMLEHDAMEQRNFAG